MDIKIGTATVTANADRRLDRNWTVEIDDAAYSYSDENWTVEAKDGIECWHPTDLADDLTKVLIEEIKKDDE